jgi:hypothetical protein
MLKWIKANRLKAALAAVLGALGLAGMAAALAAPRLDRDWEEHLAVMPSIDLRDTGFALGLATDWSYSPDGPVSKDYTTFAADFADLRNVWFVIEPHPGMKQMAHTLVLFEFAANGEEEGRVIGLTIEARRESHEKYSAFWGAFNAFELAYVWSTPKDLLTRRAVMLDHDVLIYPLDLSEEQERAFLRATLEQTIAVSTKPRFYNTLHSNCTNELAKTAGLNWHYSFVMTGYSAERLFALKMIPGADFATAKQAALMTDRIKAWNDLPSGEFDAALLKELHARMVRKPAMEAARS